MVQNGLDWVDCLHTKPISCSNAWLSFYLQLFPCILWCLVTVCMPPLKLDTRLQWVYTKTVPFLGVNSKIKHKWQMLPKMYQGFGLPNFPLVGLSLKISFLLSSWGFYGQAHSDALAMAHTNS